MKYILFLVIVSFVGMVYASSMSYVTIWGVTPHIVLVFICCLSVISGDNKSLVVVPFAGIVCDLLTNDPLGLSIIAMAPIVLLAMLFKNVIPNYRFISVIGVTVGGSVLYGAISLAILGATGQYIPLIESIYHVIILPVIVNTLLSGVCYMLFILITRRFSAEPFRLRSA